MRLALRSLCAGLVGLCGVVNAFADKPASPPGQEKRPALPPGSGGKGRGTGGRTELPMPALGGGTGSPAGAVFLAAWLDDATTLSRGEIGTGLSIGRSESLDGSETDAPVVFGAVGLAGRVQLSAGVPYSRSSYTDGYSSQGLGNAYVACKVRLLDPGVRRLGLAVSPLVEILSDASLSDETLGLSRVNWALPVSVEASFGGSRLLASTGYFSRGAVFVSAGVERRLSARVFLNAALSYMHATQVSETSDLAGLSRSRTDGSVGVAVSLSPALSLSGAVGRTLSSLDQNGATLLASAGVSYTFSKPGAP